MATQVPIEITAKFDELKKQLDDLEKHMKGWSFQIKQAIIDNVVSGGLALVKDTITGTIGEMQKWIAAAEEAEDVDKRLEIAVRNAGAGFKWTSEQLKQMASDLQDTSVFNDEEIKKVETRLVQLGLVGKTFRETLKAAVDVAASQPDADLGQTAEAIARALAVPENAARSLKAAGILLRTEQREQLEAFLATNDAAKAQGYILEAVTKNAHDAAEGMTGTWRGMKAQLSNIVDDIRESMGGGFLQLLKDMQPALKLILEHVKELAGAFKEWFVSILDGNKAKSMVDTIKEAVIQLFATIETFFARIPDNVRLIFAEIRKQINDIKADIGSVMQSFGAGLNKLPVWIKGIGNPGNGMIEAGGRLTGSAADAAGGIWGDVLNARDALRKRGTFWEEQGRTATDIREGDKRRAAERAKREEEWKKQEAPTIQDQVDAFEKRAQEWRAESQVQFFEDQFKGSKNAVILAKEAEKKAKENKQLDEQFAEMQDRMKGLQERANKESLQKELSKFSFSASIESGADVFRRIQTGAASIDPAKGTEANTKGILAEMKKLNAKMDKNRNQKGAAVAG